MTGAEERDRLRAAGFSDDEVADWEAGQRQKLAAGGFSPPEIDEYFGQPQPDMTTVRQQIEKNLQVSSKKPASGEDEDERKTVMRAVPAGEKYQKATTGLRDVSGEFSFESVKRGLLEAFEAGSQIGVGGLVERGKTPDYVVPEHAHMAERLANIAGMMYTDAPYMLAGSKAGAIAGAPIGAVGGAAVSTLTFGGAAPALIPAGAMLGTKIGASAGAFAFPAFLRKALIDQYEKGAIKDWDEFYARTYGAFKEALKHGTTGALTGAAGAYAKIGTTLSGPISQYSAQAAAEIVTMTAVGKGLEGQVPRAEDFIESGIFLVGLHGVQHAPQVKRGLHRIFVKSGLKPEVAVEEAQQNPAFREDLLAVNGEPERSFAPNSDAEPVRVMSAEETKAFNELREQEKPVESVTDEKTGQVIEVLRVEGEDPNIIRAPALEAEEPSQIEAARYDYLWDRIKAGKTKAYGERSAALAAAKKARDAGALQTRTEAEQFLRKAEELEATHTDKDLRREMAGLVERAKGGQLAEEVEAEAGQPSRWAPGESERETPESARDAILKQIYQGGKQDKSVKWYQIWKSGWWDQAYKNSLDDSHYIKILSDAFGGREIEGQENPYVRFRNAAGSGRQADYALHYGTFNLETLKDTGPGLVPMLGAWKTRLNDVRAFITGKHALELSQRVQRARKEAGEKFTGAQVGDRVAFVEKDIDAIGDVVGVKDGIAKVRWLDSEGSPKKADIPVEDLESRLISTVNGREVSNIETGVDLRTARKFVESAPAELREVGKGVVEFNKRVTRDFLVESGLVSEKTASEWEKLNPANVPLFRLMDSGSPEGSSMFTRHGSLRQIIDPIESIIRNTHAFARRANVNVAARKLVDLVRSTPDGREIFQLVKDKKVETTVSETDMAAYLKRLGANVEAEELTFFRPEKSLLEDNQLTVWRDGKREVYQVGEKYQPVVDAIRNLAPDDLPVAMGWLAKAARSLRTGATLTLEFIGTNIVRDQPATYLNSKNGYIPFLSALDGIASIATKDTSFRDFIKAGGGMSTIAELDRNYIEKNVFDLSAKTGFLGSTRNAMRTLGDAFTAIREVNETMTRVGEYKAAIREGKDPFQAAFEARDLLDYARAGARTRAMSQIVSFLNAGLQGTDKLARSMGIGKAISGVRERRLDLLLEAGEDALGMAVKATPMILATAYLWWANKEDPRYKNAPAWQKDLFWIVPTDDWQDSTPEAAADFPDYLKRERAGKWQVNTGVTFRIAKPFEAGILLFSLAERVLDKFHGKNPRAFDGFGNAMMSFVPSALPTAAVPFLEQYSNRRRMSGTKLIPSYLEGVSHDLQYTEYTTETAKAVSRIVPTLPFEWLDQAVRSPIVLENYVRGILGPLGMQGMQMLDSIGTRAGIYNAPPKPEATWADTPFFKAFTVRYPTASAQPVNDFYDRYAKIAQKKKDVQVLKGRGEFDEMDRRIEEAGDKYGVNLDQISQAIGKYRQQAHVIAFDREMTPREKRQALDGVYYAIISIAELGNEVLDDIEGVRVLPTAEETKAFNSQTEANR